MQRNLTKLGFPLNSDSFASKTFSCKVHTCFTLYNTAFQSGPSMIGREWRLEDIDCISFEFVTLLSSNLLSFQSWLRLRRDSHSCIDTDSRMTCRTIYKHFNYESIPIIVIANAVSYHILWWSLPRLNLFKSKATIELKSLPTHGLVAGSPKLIFAQGPVVYPTGSP